MSRSSRDDGVTLVELLVTITIMGLIIGPLSAGLIVGLRTAGDASVRLAGSADEQYLAIALPPDIQSTGKAAGDAVVAPTLNTDCSGLANVMRLRWTASDTGAPVVYQAAYVISGGAVSGWKLKRYFCVGGAAATVHTAARNLASATAATAVLSGTKVSMTVTEAKSSGSPSTYAFTISGNRRTP